MSGWGCGRRRASTDELKRFTRRRPNPSGCHPFEERRRARDKCVTVAPVTDSIHAADRDLTVPPEADTRTGRSEGRCVEVCGNG